MSRVYLVLLMYVAAPAVAYLEFSGLPQIDVQATFALATQLARSLVG